MGTVVWSQITEKPGIIFSLCLDKIQQHLHHYMKTHSWPPKAFSSEAAVQPGGTHSTHIYHQRVLNNVDLWQGQENIQILGSRSRCHVLPVSCGASTPFLEAFPSSCPPGLVYEFGCSVLWLDAWALWISPGSQQTALHAPFLVGPHDLVKTVLIFSWLVPSTPLCCWSRVITR